VEFTEYVNTFGALLSTATYGHQQAPNKPNAALTAWCMDSALRPEPNEECTLWGMLATMLDIDNRVRVFDLVDSLKTAGGKPLKAKQTPLEAAGAAERLRLLRSVLVFNGILEKAALRCTSPSLQVNMAVRAAARNFLCKYYGTLFDAPAPTAQVIDAVNAAGIFKRLAEFSGQPLARRDKRWLLSWHETLVLAARHQRLDLGPRDELINALVNAVELGAVDTGAHLEYALPGFCFESVRNALPFKRVGAIYALAIYSQSFAGRVVFAAILDTFCLDKCVLVRRIRLLRNIRASDLMLVKH
jgi:hypothetical protein